MENAKAFQANTRGVPPLVLLLLNKLAKVLPPLARWLESVTSLLLERYATPEQLIAQAGATAGLPSVPPAVPDATSGAPGGRPTGGPGANVGKLATVASTDTASNDASSASARAPSIELAAQEAFLRRVQESFERSQKQLETTVERCEARADVAMRLRVVGIVFTFFLIGLGAYLALLRGSGVLGMLSTLIGLLAGSGSVMLRQLENSIVAKMSGAEKRIERMEAFLQAIHAALSMSGPGRESQLAQTAEWLRTEASSIGGGRRGVPQ